MTNSIRSIAVAIAATIATASCGSSTDSTGGITTGNCSISITGAASASPACTAAVAAYSTAINTSAITLTTTSSTTFALSVGWTGNVHTGTFHSSDAGATGAITFTNGTTTWLVTPSAGSTSGTYTVTLTGVTTAGSSGTGTAYTIHGTIDATLPPVGSTGASVTLHATF